MPRARYLIVDGHSVIFAWPEFRKLHERRSSLAREALVRQLRDYQDWTGVRVVVVFDGKGKRVEATADRGDLQIYYSRSGMDVAGGAARGARERASRLAIETL
jgi:predicted RNA-binding protein with PIN domain